MSDYFRYDLVIVRGTNEMFVAMSNPIGSPGPGNLTWAYVTMYGGAAEQDGPYPPGGTILRDDSFIYRRPVTTCAVLEVAMMPTPFEIDLALIELSSSQPVTYEGSLVQYMSVPTSVDSPDVIAAYEPYEPPKMDGRTGLLATREFNTVTVPVIEGSYIVQGGTPTITKEWILQQDAGPTIQGTTIRLKRGNKADLPASAGVGEPLVTLDTLELFVGTGTGVKKVSDMAISETEPSIAERTKIWFNPVSKVTSVFKDGAWQPTVSTSGANYGTF